MQNLKLFPFVFLIFLVFNCSDEDSQNSNMEAECLTEVTFLEDGNAVTGQIIGGDNGAVTI